MPSSNTYAYKMPTNFKVARWITIAQPNCFPFITISLECDKRWYLYATPSILIDVGLTLIIFWIRKGRGRDHRVHLSRQYKLSLRVQKRVNAPKRRSGLNMIGCVIVSLFVVNLLHFFLTFGALVLSTLDMDLVWLTHYSMSIKMTWHIHSWCRTS